jgi:hypothetical protein
LSACAQDAQYRFGITCKFSFSAAFASLSFSIFPDQNTRCGKSSLFLRPGIRYDCINDLGADLRARLTTLIIKWRSDILLTDATHNHTPNCRTASIVSGFRSECFLDLNMKDDQQCTR